MKNFLCITLFYAFAISHVLGGTCESRFTPWEAWSNGRNGQMNFSVPSETAKWRVLIFFDKPVNSIEASDGTKEKCKPRKNRCSFKNQEWNSNNAAGSNLALGIQMNFDDTESHPLIKKLIFSYCTSDPCEAWTKYVVDCGEDTDSGEGGTGGESTDEPTNPGTDAPETEAPGTEGPEEPTEEPDITTESKRNLCN